MSVSRFPRPERKGVFVIAWNERCAFYLIKANSEWEVYRVNLPLPPSICGRWECTLLHFLHYKNRGGVWDWLDHCSDEEITKHTQPKKENG